MQEISFDPALPLEEDQSIEYSTDGSTWQKVEKPASPPTPNRATRRAKEQHMRRLMKHISRAFVLTCAVCHKPFIAPIAQKCACPVDKPLRGGK